MNNVREGFIMDYPQIRATADEIAALGKPLQVYLISHKTNHASGELISFKLAVIVQEDTPSISELECFLYTAVDCDVPYDLVLYRESEWNALSTTPGTFAWSIRENGSVLA